MKLFIKVGEEILRILPPSKNWPAFVSPGQVISFDDKTVTCEIIVDVPRRMTFSQENGIGVEGFGDFIIRGR